MILVHYSYRAPSFILLNLATRRERLISPSSVGAVHKWRVEDFRPAFISIWTWLKVLNLRNLLCSNWFWDNLPVYQCGCHSWMVPPRLSRTPPFHPRRRWDQDFTQQCTCSLLDAHCTAREQRPFQITTLSAIVWILGCVTLPPIVKVTSSGNLWIWFFRNPDLTDDSD